MVRPRGSHALRRLRRRPLPALSGHHTRHDTGRGGGRPGHLRRGAHGRGPALRHTLLEVVRRHYGVLRVLLGACSSPLSRRPARQSHARHPGARPDERGRSRSLDPLRTRGFLSHYGRGHPQPSAQQLRPRDARLLSLDGGVHARRACRPDPPQERHRLRRYPQPASRRARPIGTHRATPDRRQSAHIHHRQGAGDPPHALRDTPL